MREKKKCISLCLLAWSLKSIAKEFDLSDGLEKEFSMINDPFHQQYFDKSSTMVYLFSISFSREVPSAFDCSYLNRIIQMNMIRKIANAKKQTKGNRRKEKELLNYLR